MKIRDRIKEFRRVPAKDLLPNPKNWRVHSEAQANALRGILADVGYVDALLARENGNGRLVLIDGHLRAETTPDMEVPVLVLDVTEEEADKILATFDPLAAMATADAEKLEALLSEIETDSEDLQAMLDELAEEAGIEVEEPEIVDPEPQIDRAEELRKKWKTKRGQLWEITGPSGMVHRLLCGDSTDAGDVERVMDGESIDTIVSDPPYGIGFDTDYRRFTSGFDVPRTKHNPIEGDDKPFDPSPFIDFDKVVLFGANCFCNRLPLGTWLIWDKRFKNGTAMLSDAEIAWMKGGHGVYIFAETSQGFVRPEAIEHPTQKPVSVMAWCIEKCKAGPIVYDPFVGSGTTICAGEQLGRRVFAVEISPAYVAVTLERLKSMGATCQLDD